MKKVLLLLLAFLSMPAIAADGKWDTTASVHKEYWVNAPTLPPLDSPLVMGRRDAGGTGTHEIMSLIYEQDATTDYKYPWPLYIQLTQNNANGQGTGANVRLINNSTAWGVAIHAEGIAKGGLAANTIGFNSEMSPITGSAGRVIAYNANARNGYGTDNPEIWSEVGLNIQSETGAGFIDGIKIDDNSQATNAFRIKSTANVTYGFKNESSNTDVALATGPAPIALRTQAFSKISLATDDSVYFYYDSANQRIQFRSGTHFIGYIDINNWNNNCMNC